jgi:dipeptidase E
MKLALYSSGLHNSDKATDTAVYTQLLQKKISPRFSLIVASPDAYDFVVPAFSNYLADYCSPIVDVIVPEKSSETEIIAKLEKSDLIFLSGGNTYHFLNNVRKYNLEPVLRRLAARNVVLVGSSAGAILMTPTIEATAYPTFDADKNDVSIKDLTGLSLVKFEMTPHYVPSKIADDELSKYSETNNRPLYALEDGAAIIVDGAKESLFGTIVMFDNGVKSKIQCSNPLQCN